MGRVKAAREEGLPSLMLCQELGQTRQGAVGQKPMGTCPISDGEELGES